MQRNAIENSNIKAICKNITVVTATDGNHGKSVAWGAREFGCQCKIYIHHEVSKGREQAIAKFSIICANGTTHAKPPSHCLS